MTLLTLPDLPDTRPGAPSSHTAAVVVTYNRKALLRECLEALLNQSVPPERIYVMDNASTDGTAAIIPDDERVTYLRLEHNLGGAYGFARGVERALEGDHEFLWLMDDDCRPEPDALERLLHHRDGDEVRCSAVLARDGTYDLGHRRRFDRRRLTEHDLPARVYQAPSVPIDIFTFVGVLIPAQAARQAGLPVDNYFFMYDDSEYALRLLDLGVTARLIPGSRIWHHGSVSYPSPRPPYNPLKHYYNTRNQLLVYRHYGSSPAWFAVRFSVKAAGAFVRLVQHRELNWRSARNATLALYDALRGRAYIRPGLT